MIKNTRIAGSVSGRMTLTKQTDFKEIKFSVRGLLLVQPNLPNVETFEIKINFTQNILDICIAMKVNILISLLPRRG